MSTSPSSTPRRPAGRHARTGVGRGTTLRDLARLADVHPSTVSLALSGDPRVAVATRDKLVLLVREHHYTPNASRAVGARPGQNRNTPWRRQRHQAGPARRRPL